MIPRFVLLCTLMFNNVRIVCYVLCPIRFAYFKESKVTLFLVMSDQGYNSVKVPLFFLKMKRKRKITNKVEPITKGNCKYNKTRIVIF